MPTYRITVGEHLYTVEVGDVSRSPVEVNVDGQTFYVDVDAPSAEAVQPPTRRGRRPPSRIAPPALPRVGSSAPAFDPSDKILRAPMPGRVIAIRVRPGDRVAAGDEVCVVEAMKMEHSIRSPADAAVAAVHCAVGDRVDEGVELVSLQD